MPRRRLDKALEEGDIKEMDRHLRKQHIYYYIICICIDLRYMNIHICIYTTCIPIMFEYIGPL